MFMKIWEYLTTPPVLEDEYAKQILNLKISWEEVFNTVYFFCGTNHFFSMVRNG